MHGLCNEFWEIVVRLNLPKPVNGECGQAVVLIVCSVARPWSGDGGQVFWRVEICREWGGELMHAAGGCGELAEVQRSTPFAVVEAHAGRQRSDQRRGAAIECGEEGARRPTRAPRFRQLINSDRRDVR